MSYKRLIDGILAVQKFCDLVFAREMHFYNRSSSVIFQRESTATQEVELYLSGIPHALESFWLFEVQAELAGLTIVDSTAFLAAAKDFLTNSNVPKEQQEDAAARFVLILGFREMREEAHGHFANRQE